MNLTDYTDQFRDHLPTVTKDGKRKWIFPIAPSGWWHRRRAVVSLVLLSLLFIGPWLHWKGEPMFLFNVLQRKFILFGSTFWPQDTIFLILALLTFFVFIILFTVAFGRVWCGWACPQTLFMEMVFRKIEYWVEGDAATQRRLKTQSWNREKVQKRTLKFGLFFLISLVIAHTVMAYIIGVNETWVYILAGPAQFPFAFLALMIFTGIFFVIFAFVREHACTFICPYGRLQGVLMNPDTIMVSYDVVRGEPRGKAKKQEETTKGDCVDCFKCVAVCPTGIDIRNGSQMECVQCTACIDACNDIMTKLNRPPNLIRYDSEQRIKNGKKPGLDARKIGYTAILTILAIVFIVLLVTRNDVEATLTRVPGQRYAYTDDGLVSNVFKLQVVNKTNQAMHLELLPTHPQGRIRMVTAPKPIAGGEKTDWILFLDLPKQALDGHNVSTGVELKVNDEIIETIHTTFNGPWHAK